MPSRSLSLARSAAALTLLLAAAPAQAGPSSATELPNGVAAGDVTASSAVLWARVPRSGFVRFEIARASSPRNKQRIWKFSRNDLVPVRAKVRGLRANTEYVYSVRAGRYASKGRFRTPARSGKHGFRFGVSGDGRGDLAPFPSIRNAKDRELDLFIHHGDTIYADVPSPAVNKPQAITQRDFRLKHEEIYSSRAGLNAMRDLRKTCAWMATIDDHEVTNDFAGGADPKTDPRFTYTTEKFINETQLYRRGIRAFSEFHALDDKRYGRTGERRTERKTKLYRSRRHGDDAQIILLDNRSFRDAALPPVTNLTDIRKILEFLQKSHDPRRTMLGKAQLEDLERDLLAAHKDGVTWKFVIVPEPIMNLGVLFAQDRFEGYAAERTRILSFIEKNKIENVVFIAADIHGTVVNNLSYENAAIAPRIPINAFEVVTGPIAYDAPLGPTIVGLAAQLRLITPEQLAFYQRLPRAQKDLAVEFLINFQITGLLYDPLGLQGSSIRAKLLQGGYTAAHTYGWTEFDIDAKTQELTVTTYGVDPYTPQDVVKDPKRIAGLQPVVVSRFVVTPR